ncbi:MAG: hypothetical protein JXR94_11515, partial [Candidatus Hydrogenedentes bacterium]|nr:hypothetical protein [Candidatus Hydrogenedentota bacterium]
KVDKMGLYLATYFEGGKKAGDPEVVLKPLTERGARDSKQWVLETAGARRADKDPVDERILQTVRTDGGHIIDSPKDVGGFPDIEPATRALDVPAEPGGDVDGDGYTDLEEWLHAMAAAVEGAE